MKRMSFDKSSAVRVRSRSKGFTLIELMIVVGIVAVLVALAVPAYTDYTIRTKVTECIEMLAVPKTTITEYRQTMGHWPSSAAQAGVEDLISSLTSGKKLSKYCQIRAYLPDSGSMLVLVDSAALGVDMAGMAILPLLSPYPDITGGVSWECTLGATEAEALKYLPASCRDENIL